MCGCHAPVRAAQEPQRPCGRREAVRQCVQVARGEGGALEQVVECVAKALLQALPLLRVSICDSFCWNVMDHDEANGEARAGACILRGELVQAPTLLGWKVPRVQSGTERGVTVGRLRLDGSSAVVQ